MLCCAGGGGSSRTIESVGSNSPSLSPPTFGTMHRGDRPNALLSSQNIRHDNSHQQHQLQQEEEDDQSAEEGTPLPHTSGERIVQFVLPTPSPDDGDNNNSSRAAWQVHVQAASASACGEAWWLELAGEYKPSRQLLCLLSGLLSRTILRCSRATLLLSLFRSRCMWCMVALLG